MRAIVDAPEDVDRALAAALCDEYLLGPSAADRLPAVAACATPPFPELSDREREVLGLLATDAHLGRLGMTTRTLRQHVAQIVRKTGAMDAADAARLARAAGGV